jgi:transcriptional regulator with XRE-family HTH domain
VSNVENNSTETTTHIEYFSTMGEELNNILKYRDLHKLTNEKLAELLGVDRTLPGKWEAGKAYPSRNKFPQFAAAMGMTLDQLKGLKDQVNGTRERETNEATDYKLIPLYDTITVGGTKMNADLEPTSEPVEYVYPGTWFKDAVAAVKVYGDSMWPKYPNGCMVTCREVKNRNLLLWGQVYVIETSEYRVIKRVQKGETREFIKADSDNTVKNAQGKEIHESMDVPLNEVRRMFLVLGKAERVQA